MVKLNRIYTRGGDKGATSLGDGSRVSKSNSRVDAYGNVDELNSWLGISALTVNDNAKDQILRIQNDLFDLGADLCVPESDDAGRSYLRITQHQVKWLETRIDDMNVGLQELKSFVLPGGNQSSASLHVARTMARRAERSMVHLSSEVAVNPLALQYVNRLSDYLFVLARVENDNGKGDVMWIPGKDRSDSGEVDEPAATSRALA